MINYPFEQVFTVEDLLASRPDSVLNFSDAGKFTPTQYSYLDNYFPRENNQSRQYYSSSWWGKNFNYPQIQLAHVRNAKLTPGNLFDQNSNASYTTASVRQEDGTIIDISLHNRRRKIIKSHDLNFDNYNFEFHNGYYMWIGHIFPHYGHFLLESLARLWPLKLLKLDNFKFVAHIEGGNYALPFIQQFFSLLGISEQNLICVDSPKQFEQLLVPTASYALGVYNTPFQDSTWQLISSQIRVNTNFGSKVYFSRLRFNQSKPKTKRFLNEEEIERLFEDNGFQVIYPETLSVEQQISAAKNAGIVAGCIGSAMYNAAFMKENGKVFIIAPDNFCFPDDLLISHYRKNHVFYLFVQGNHLEGESTRKQNISVDIKHLKTNLLKLSETPNLK